MMISGLKVSRKYYIFVDVRMKIEKIAQPKYDK